MGNTPSNPRSQKHHIKKWTTPFYRQIQDARRKGSEATNDVERINRYLAQRFRDTTIRAPLVPREFQHTEYIYRAVHDFIEESLMRDGYFHDKGYVAFSRSLEVAKKFGTTILRLRVGDVPRGTPWIWFKHHEYGSNVQRRRRHMESSIDEQEVLLPPGVVKLQRRIRLPNLEPQYRVFDATYEPSWNAKSVRGHPIHRRYYRE